MSNIITFKTSPDRLELLIAKTVTRMDYLGVSYPKNMTYVELVSFITSPDIHAVIIAAKHRKLKSIFGGQNENTHH